MAAKPLVWSTQTWNDEDIKTYLVGRDIAPHAHNVALFLDQFPVSAFEERMSGLGWDVIETLAAGLPFEGRVQYCRACGALVSNDPDGSPGVVVHLDDAGDRDHDADADHVAIPENEED